MTELDFTGRTVLLTGAATGIGRATALAFGARGAAVTLGDVDEHAEDTAAAIVEAGGSAVFVPTDVRQPDQVEALVSRAVATYGHLDIAVNNAGALPPTAPLAQQTMQDWNTTLGVDATGVFVCLQYEIAHMQPLGQGSIINTASVAGLIADPGMAPYVAAKHAVVGLTKAAALDYATSGVRINAVAPGLVRTPMIQRWLDDPAMRTSVLADSPIGRAAEPEEITGAVLFLASELAGAVTGAVYPVDGGRTVH